MKKTKLFRKSVTVILAAAVMISGVPGEFDSLGGEKNSAKKVLAEEVDETGTTANATESPAESTGQAVATEPAVATESPAISQFQMQASSFSIKNGIINMNNTKYYKVDAFVSGQDYIIGVKNENGNTETVLSTEGDGVNTFTYTYRVDSVGNKGLGISGVDGYTMFCADSGVTFESTSTAYSWTYADSKLSCSDGTNTWYVTFNDNKFSCTKSKAAAAKIDIFTGGETLSRCITEEPEEKKYVLQDSQYETPTFSIGYNKDITIDKITWFVNGQEQKQDDDSENASTAGKNVFKAYSLEGLAYGVYPVYCEITGHDGTYYYKEKSNVINFIVCTGVVPNSFVTFSDVHEEFERIGYAIKSVMNANGGMIPGLVICTGDWVNGGTASDDELEKIYMPKIKGALGGLDTVFVSGNHESGGYTATQTLMSGLGATEDIADGIGVIFDSDSESAKVNGSNSLSNQGLVVYGINFSATEVVNQDGSKTYTYAPAITQLDQFLSQRAQNYKGELIVISAHTGLHALGIQPESLDYKTYEPIEEMAGENKYNLNDSDKMVDVLNKYANEYKMDIMYFFGHNHSKNEVEFDILSGQNITSTMNFAENTTMLQPIAFNYGHAGYLSTAIGSANNAFTYVTYDSANITRQFTRLGKDNVTVDNQTDEIITRKSVANPGSTATPATKAAAKRKNEIYILQPVIQKVQGLKQMFNLNACAISNTVNYSSDNKDITVDQFGYVTIKKDYVGSAVITITASGSNYETVSKTVVVNVIPKRVELKKEKRLKKGFKLKWKKIPNIDGYEINYSRKKLSKNKKIKVVTTTKKKIKIKKLEKKKKYYIRIRAFANVKSGSKKVKLYSDWVETEIKTKK
ncbi:MAG: metallophosphoesterase [Lachnospiraceae bacterium]|nr:metallophosphoesterase [Lachnospiraceae bacterium]